MDNGKIELRRFPYPYRAMMAICSDLDETPDRQVYWEIMRFLNTTETTSIGPGVGLEVGNSIYFDMPPGQFSYGNTDDAGREMVRTLIRSGHIDCLHSYGDLAITRRHAGQALDELTKHECRIEVWVDHGTAPTNFGGDIMHGHGDEPGHSAYHADLTCGYGVKYVWRGRVTSMIGQDAPPSLGGISSLRHPVSSSRTLAKEALKGVLARRGNTKYAMHGPNELVRRNRLRDGREALEFIRCNPHWGGVSCADRGTRLGEVITVAFLDRLVERQGACILYTHLGKIADRQRPFGLNAIAAFRLLAEYQRSGKVLVTTTHRLLAYHRMVRETRVESVQEDGVTRLEISPLSDDQAAGKDGSGSEPEGLTIHVSASDRTHVSVKGREVTGIRRNGPDHTGRHSVSVPWRSIEFPHALWP